MARHHGRRAPRGKRCRIALPHGHYKTTTITAALPASSPFAVDLVNGARFRTYVADVRVPALRSGDTVIMNNLSAQKVTDVSQLIGAAGACLLYLPPYSPGFKLPKNSSPS